MPAFLWAFHKKLSLLDKLHTETFHDEEALDQIFYRDMEIGGKILRGVWDDTDDEEETPEEETHAEPTSLRELWCHQLKLAKISDHPTIFMRMLTTIKQRKLNLPRVERHIILELGDLIQTAAEDRGLCNRPP